MIPAAGLLVLMLVLLACFAYQAWDLYRQDHQPGMTHTQVVVALGYAKGLER